MCETAYSKPRKRFCKYRLWNGRSAVLQPANKPGTVNLKHGWNLRMKLTRLSLALSAALCGTVLLGQETPLAWNAASNFAYTIERVTPSPVSSSSWTVKVIFSVANPAPSPAFPSPVWDIKTALPITGGSLRILVGWDGAELSNTNSRGNLNPVATAPSNIAAAAPISLNALAGATAAQPCTPSNCGELGASPMTNRFTVSTVVNPIAFPPGGAVSSGIVGIEGRPVCPLTGPLLPGCPSTNGAATAANIPVTSAARSFSFTGAAVADRRKIVDIANCKKCHDGAKHGDTVVPRLSLHGANRNENLLLCVICHNANQTDIPFRASGPEVSIDFKRMIHSIHAGGFRKTPLQIVGFQGTLFDFSHVRFPAKLRNCTACHVGASYALPISPKALGSTIDTRSTQATATALRTVDVDPANDSKITPAAASCSGCHDSSEVQRHMVRTGGASFGTQQQNIVSGVTERCVNCHGPGKKEDVRKVHEIGR